METLYTSTWWFTWVGIPLLIFCARILDVSIGTLRLILIAKGMKNVAPILGFFEVIIWLLAVVQIMQHLDNWVSYIAYGAGFATGNYIGMLLEERLALGISIIRVILPSDNPALIKELKSDNYGLTIVDAEGAKGPVKILFSIIRRKEISGFVNLLHNHFPNVFYTIEDVKSASEGVFRPVKDVSTLSSISAMLRKGK